MSLIKSLLLFGLFFVSTILAAKSVNPMQLNVNNSGKLAEKVVFSDENIFVMPAEIILDSNPDCHAFGFIVIEYQAVGQAVTTGILRRLVCKNKEIVAGEPSFTVWNLHGSFYNDNTQEQNSKTITNKSTEENAFEIEQNLKISVFPTKFGNPRQGNHIYLFAKNLTPKPFKVPLGALPSFGGEQLEELPELIDETTTVTDPEEQQAAEAEEAAS